MTTGRINQVAAFLTHPSRSATKGGEQQTKRQPLNSPDAAEAGTGASYNG